MSVRVTPGSGRSTLVEVAADELRVRVASLPVDGRANDAVVRLLADVLELKTRQVSIAGGPHSRSKLVWVDLGVDGTVAAIDRALSRSSQPKR